jgi:hypothetical protein
MTPTPKNQFTLLIDVESDRDANDLVKQFQRYFDDYHPSLKAKVRKQVEENPADRDNATATEAGLKPRKARTAKVEEDLL